MITRKNGCKKFRKTPEETEVVPWLRQPEEG